MSTTEHHETKSALTDNQTTQITEHKSNSSLDHKDDKEKNDLINGFSTQQENRLMRRVDFRLLPIICALYMWSLIDRVNMGTARIEGLVADLNMGINSRYNIALLVFFPGYFLVEFPGNLIIRRVGPRLFLTVIGVLWGVIMLGMGFVTDYRQLIVLRAVLGCLEGGFFPGCVYLISSWYKKFELQRRLAVFYMSSVIAGGFSPILAYGLARITPYGDNTGGWSWIFIIEGTLTAFTALLAWFFIVDFPEKAKFINENEKAFIVERLNRDRGDAVHDGLTFKKVVKYLLEWKNWVFSLMFMCATMVPYAMSYFLPVIFIYNLGYTIVKAQCLAAPPFVFSAILALVESWLSDKFKIRYPFIIFNAIVVIVGAALLWAEGMSGGVKYFAAFIVLAGCQPNVPAIITFMQNNIVKSSRRSVGSALQIGFGAIGGIMGSTVFRDQDLPRYLPGLQSIVACQLFLIVATAGLAAWFSFQNKRANSGKVVIDKEFPAFRYVI